MVYLYQFFLHIYEMFRNETLIRYVCMYVLLKSTNIIFIKYIYKLYRLWS